MVSAGPGGNKPFSFQAQPIIVGKRSQQSGFLVRHSGLLISIFLVVLLLGVGAVTLLLRPERSDETATTAAPRTEQKRPVLLGEQAAETEIVPLYGEANYRSESFQVGEIAIGGEAEFLLTEDNPAPLQISGIRGEVFSEKAKKEVRLLVSWKTNKLAVSRVSFSKGAGSPVKTTEEEDYSLGHSLILPGLDQASTYIYTISSRDRYGNEAESESHAIYTGTRTVSLFELIANAVSDVFGWAVKK